MRTGHQSRSAIIGIRVRLLRLGLIRLEHLLRAIDRRGMCVRPICLRIIRGLWLWLRAVRPSDGVVIPRVGITIGVVWPFVQCATCPGCPSCVWVGTVARHAGAAYRGRGAVPAELCHVGRGGVERAYAVGGTAEWAWACVVRGGDEVFRVEVHVGNSATAPATLEGDQQHIRQVDREEDEKDLPGKMR
jgi:hypothetical protein